MQKKVTKNKSSLVKDLTGVPATSVHYQACIEQVCDDLLENADKQIDKIKSIGKTQANVAMAVDGRNSSGHDRRMRTENALKKP